MYKILRPLLFVLPPETAHGLAIQALKLGLMSGNGKDHESLKTTLWGKEFSNPIGLAAGFDKNAEVMAQAGKMGFGFVEAGSVTPKPQSGNPKPRLFRLVEDNAIINRMGFNNVGLDEFVTNFKGQKSKAGGLILGANVGKNKDTQIALDDYAKGIKALAQLADYLVINVSSPNTPGLRDLQGRDELKQLIKGSQTARKNHKTPILVKIAPDLTPQSEEDITSVLLACDVDGVIISNTTIARPDFLQSVHKSEAGGLSGACLMDPSTTLLARFYKRLAGKVPIIGVGGVSSGADAYRKIRAGASLVQLYSALIYQGPELVQRIKDDLVDLLNKDGFINIEQAVGADHE